MKKVYKKQNVLDATLQRLDYIFKEFDNVVVAFSCGKDSGVLLNLAYNYAKENGMLSKMAMYYMDYEADYKETDEFAYRSFTENFKGIRKYWLCLPISAQCSCSMENPFWVPWDEEKKDIWVKDMPNNEYVVNAGNVPFEFEKGRYGADVRLDFCKWYSSQFGKTAVLVGIRCDESLNRLAILTSTQRVNMYDGIKYSKKIDERTYSFYPLYDWETGDIWTANAKFGFDYNKAYDLMYMAGLSPLEMRIASPFHSCGQSTLKLYRALSPNTWGRMVSRVNGVNFMNIYGGTFATGYKSAKKPDHLTWKQYMEFLLSTLPKETRERYETKFEKSKWHWRVQGGARSEEFIRQLEAEGVPLRRSGHGSKSCKVNTDKEVIFIDDWFDDTNVDDFRKAPTYKRACIAILKNDVQCIYCGFSRTKEEEKRRKNIIEKYKNIL